MTVSFRLRRTGAILGTTVALLLGIQQPAAAQDTAYAVEPVAVTGEAAPGTGGLSYESVYFNDLNDAGVVTFRAYPDGIWMGTPGNVSLIVRAGDPVPGVAAVTFQWFADATLTSETGVVTFTGTFWDGAFPKGDGIWTSSAGALNLLATSTDPAPGTPGYPFLPHSYGAASIDNTGATTFNGAFETPTGYGLGAWKGTPGSLEALVVSGDPAPDTAGLHFGNIMVLPSDAAGTAIVVAETDDPAEAYPGGYWKFEPGGLTAIAQAGDVAPGTGGRTFGYLKMEADVLLGEYAYGEGANPNELVPWNIMRPVLSESGHIAFNAYLNPIDPAAGAPDEGVWIHDDTGLRLVALVGDPAPGTAGLQFTDFNNLNFNSLGEFAFDAAVNSGDATTNRGIWRGLPGSLNLLVREGDLAPGANGEHFGNLALGPSMNDKGEIVFYAELAESGTLGVWHIGTDGTVSLILREGEAVRSGFHDYRTVQNIFDKQGMPSSIDQWNHFNEAGQASMKVEFTDGTSGLLLASPISTATNQPPVADAGPDRTVIENKTITIDGGASFDPENTVLKFVWSLDGVEVATGPQYTAGPFGVGTHTVTLTVTDRGGATASDDMSLTVDPNLPPVANAGPDRTVNFVQTVSLDGSGSSDPEGLALGYVWTLDGAQIATGPNPTVGPFSVGARTITLTVTDDQGLSASDGMVVNVLNETPVADAGVDQTVQTLETVVLDGSASSDPEGETLSYEWSLDGQQIAAGPAPVVGPFAAGLHTITLTVTDGHGASATDGVVLTVQNRAPTADAGPDQTVNHAQTVMLDASGSIDPEGGSLSYAWSVDGIQVATGVTATVGPFEVGTHSITLTVIDDHGATATDIMALTVINEAPVANAGPDQTVGVKGKTTTVTLDGSASADPEGGALSYVWTLDGQTVGTGPVAQADVAPGTHVFTLTVTDDHGATDTDTMIVTAVRGNA